MTIERTWEPEDEEQPQPQPQPVKPKSVYDLKDYPTTKFVLLNSDKNDYGEVRVVEDFFDTGYKEGELIGTWTRVPYDGLIHGELTTPLIALQDRSIQITAKHARDREAKKKSPGRPATPTEDRGEVAVEMNALRAKLMGSKQ